MSGKITMIIIRSIKFKTESDGKMQVHRWYKSGHGMTWLSFS